MSVLDIFADVFGYVANTVMPDIGNTVVNDMWFGRRGGGHGPGGDTENVFFQTFYGTGDDKERTAEHEIEPTQDYPQQDIGIDR
jgi:hypothetical protein